MVRSAPAQNVSLPEVMTAPLIAASAATFSMMLGELLHHLEVDDVHRAAGRIPGDERDYFFSSFLQSSTKRLVPIMSI